jgi:hypothetical protein
MPVRSVLAVSLLLTASLLRAQPVAPVSANDYGRLLKATKFIAYYQEAAAVSARVFAARGQGNDRQYAAFMDVVAKADLSDINSCLVDVYERQNLSPQDVTSLIAFFESPLGQRFLLQANRMLKAGIERGSPQPPSSDIFTEDEKRVLNEVQQRDWYRKYAQIAADPGVAAANMKCIVQSHAVQSSGIQY